MNQGEFNALFLHLSMNPTLRSAGTSVALILAGVGDMDEDLLDLEREALVAEIKRLRAGIRAHRDSSGHELCWHHPKLWSLLPEKTDPLPRVPAWPQFLRGCLRYRESLDTQLPDAPRMQREYDR
jgi:hypothetical protein